MELQTFLNINKTIVLMADCSLQGELLIKNLIKLCYINNHQTSLKETDSWITKFYRKRHPEMLDLDAMTFRKL